MGTSAESVVQERNVETVFVAVIPEPNAVEKFSKLDSQLDANPQILTIHPVVFKGVNFRFNPNDPIPDGFARALTDRANKETAGRRAALNKLLNNPENPDPSPIVLIVVLRGIIESPNDIADLSKKGIRLSAVVSVYDESSSSSVAKSITDMASANIPELGFGQIDINKPFDLEMIGLVQQTLGSLRQWRQWRSDVPIVSLPSWTPDMEPGCAHTYAKLMDSLPATFHSVEHVLCAMFYQVQSWIQKTEPAELPPPTLDKKLASIWERLETDKGLSIEESASEEVITHTDRLSRQQALHCTVDEKGQEVNQWFFEEGIRLRHQVFPVPCVNAPDSRVEVNPVTERSKLLFSLPSGIDEYSQWCSCIDEISKSIGECSNPFKQAIWRENVNFDYLSEVIASYLDGSSPVPFDIKIQTDSDYICLILHANSPNHRSYLKSGNVTMCGDVGLDSWQRMPENIRNQRQPALIQGRNDALRLIRNSTVFFPADRGVMGSLKLNCNVVHWVSLAEQIFITACQNTFKAKFVKDDSQVEIAKDRIYCRAFDGNYCSVGFDGVILCQRHDGKLWRIDPCGIVTSRFGEQSEAMFPDSTVVTLRSATSWTVTTSDGCVRCERGDCVPLEVVRQTDPYTGDVVTTRADGVMSIAYAKGERYAHVFRDWTRITVSPERTTVAVPGVAEIVLEGCPSSPAQINISAEHQPAISIDTRMSTFMISSGQIQLIGSPSRLILSSDNSVQLQKDWPNVNHITGCYIFSNGALSLQDSDGSYFELGSDGVGVQRPVASSSPRSKANPVEPSGTKNSIVPRVFLLQSNGNGFELIKATGSTSVSPYDDFALVDRKPMVNTIDEEPASELLRYRKTYRCRRMFLTKLDVPNIVRDGAGCSTVLEFQEPLTPACAIERALIRCQSPRLAEDQLPFNV